MTWSGEAPRLGARVRSWLKSLTIMQRITFALVVVALVNVVVQLAVGAPNVRGHAGNLLIAVFVFFLSRLRLWRVRNRLLLSYFLFGVVPLTLVVGLALVTATTLFGLIAADRVRRALDERVSLTATLAREVATLTSYRHELDTSALSQFAADLLNRLPRAHAVIVAGDSVRSIPDAGPVKAIPGWSTAGFSGLLDADGRYFVAAHAKAGDPAVEVLVYAPLAEQDLATLTPDVAALAPMPLADEDDINQQAGPGGSTVSIERSGVRTPFEYSNAVLPPKRGFWDPALGWAVKRNVRTLSGDSGEVLLTFVSRPSLLMPRLADPSDLGPGILAALALIIGGLLLIVIIGSMIWSARLTRTITRAVHDLYEGTRQVAAGNLAHRTAVRGKDQLSELASSFNGMTERVQQLIVEVGEKKKLESELEIARGVQLQQFPKSVPKLATLEVAALCIPSRFVSGDYYDYVSLTSGRLALALGDVSGKGISAALVMASLQSALHAQLRHAGADGSADRPLSTAVLMGQLSEQLYENTPAEKYATFFCSTYDDRTGQLLYTNAGHLPPILIRGHQTMRLDVGGTVVGLMPIFSYDQQVVELQPGDLLAMFTDGITEAEDASGEQFGDERLADLLMANRDKPLAEIVRLVADRVRAWAHDPENADDTTILLARRL